MEIAIDPALQDTLQTLADGQNTTIQDYATSVITAHLTREYKNRVFRHECGSAEGLRWAGDVGRQRCWIELPGC